jgi:hypothetical protein
MFGFYVVDLASQKAAFVRFTDGWARTDILAYLRWFGPVFAFGPMYPDRYAFFAPCGLRTAFTLTETGEWFFFP